MSFFRRSSSASASLLRLQLDPATDLVLKEYMKVLRQHNQLLSTQADCLIQVCKACVLVC